MSSDLLVNLHFDSKLQCNVVVVKEMNNCDSSFITSCLLSNWIRNQEAILIVSTHNSLSHYQCVGLRMNYNLQKCIDSGNLIFYNLGEEIVSNIVFNKQTTLDQSLSNLKEKIYQLNKTSNALHIIFDGLSHLFDLDFTIKNINKFTSDVINVCQNISRTSVLFHCNVAKEDDVTCTLANLLTHKATTVLEVEHLQSGLSADVSGHLIIKYPKRKFQKEYITNLEQKPTKYLFKLFDRGVKMFAPGTV